MPRATVEVIKLAGSYPDTTIRVGYTCRAGERTLDVAVWDEPEEILRENYNAVFSTVRALIQEDVDTWPN